jgi:hypothetical protein
MTLRSLAAVLAGWQESVVQSFPSSQFTGVCVQPLIGLHPSSVQPSLSSQLIAVCTQPVAGLQVSVVQALLSSQLMAVYWQVPALHVSAVHALLSLQSPLTLHGGAGRYVTDNLGRVAVLASDELKANPSSMVADGINAQPRFEDGLAFHV